MKKTKELDLDAHYYVNHSSLQNTLAKNLLNDFSFSSRAHILDVGCGDGRLTADMASRANEGEVIGLDSSPSMVQFASQTFPVSEFPNLKFRLGMAEESSFSQQFDLVTAFSCFHWLKDPKKAFCQLSTSLKKNGEMLILTYPKESPYYLYLEEALDHFPEYGSLSAINTMLSTIDYRKNLTENGFEIIDFELRKLTSIYASPEELKSYIKGWLTCYVPLPETLQPAFLDYVCKAVLNDPNAQTVNTIQIPYLVLVINAKKI